MPHGQRLGYACLGQARSWRNKVVNLQNSCPANFSLMSISLRGRCLTSLKNGGVPNYDMTDHQRVICNCPPLAALFLSRPLGFVCRICCVRKLKKKKSGTCWRSRCFPLISSWQCPIWCGRAAEITDSLPSCEQTLILRLTGGEMPWDGGSVNEWARQYPLQI